MKLLNKLNVVGAGLAFYAISTLKAMAAGATPVPIPQTPAPIPDANGFIDLINKIATWASYLFWGFAVIFIFYAAFLYLTGSGEEEKIKKAHKQLIYALIAIVVALFAYGMPALIHNILTSGSSPAPYGRDYNDTGTPSPAAPYGRDYNDTGTPSPAPTRTPAPVFTNPRSDPGTVHPVGGARP